MPLLLQLLYSATSHKHTPDLKFKARYPPLTVLLYWAHTLIGGEPDRLRPLLADDLGKIPHEPIEWLDEAEGERVCRGSQALNMRLCLL